MSTAFKIISVFFRVAVAAGFVLFGGIISAQQPVSTDDSSRESAKLRLAMSYDLGNAKRGPAASRSLVVNDATVQGPAGLVMSNQIDNSMHGPVLRPSLLASNATNRAPIGLLELATHALADHPTLRMAAASTMIDDERVEQARGVLRPSASGTLTYQHEFERAGTTVPFRNQSGGVEATFPLYRPQAFAAIDVARFKFESTSAQSAETGNALLAAIVTGYFGAIQQATETRTLLAERELLLAQRDINEKRMRGGIGTLVEVLETAARADLLTGQVRGAEGAEKVLLAELARLAVMPVTAVYFMKDEPPALVVPGSVEAAFETARRTSPTLNRLQKALDSARANVGAQKGAYLPSIDVVANLNRSWIQYDGSSSLSPSTGIGIRLSVPLYSGGITDSRVREAYAQVERATEELRDSHNTLQSELLKAYADLDRGQSQLAANVAALRISQSALEATVKAFNAGVRSNIDVLNVQQQAFSTRREAARARVAIQLAQSRILALTGTLDLAAIGRLALSLGG